MRFPGDRNPKHYFPVTARNTGVVVETDEGQGADGQHPWYVVGLDEVLVDVQVQASAALIRDLGLVPGESIQLTPDECQRVLTRFVHDGLPCTFSAGGTVANTLNNFTFLSGEPAVLLGAVESAIRPGSPAFAYVAQTPKGVDLSNVLPVDGATGLAITFIDPDGERSFGVAPGIAGDYPADALPEGLVEGSAVALTSLYCLADPTRPIAGAALRMLEIACARGIPTAFGMGTAGLVRRMRQQVQEILAEYVTIAAMNAREAEALTGESDALLACRRILEWVDVVLVTEGPRGLTLAGYTDEGVKRLTRETVRSGAIAEYNKYEFSRLLRRADCEQPIPVFSHVHPYRGGPDRLRNTSGAGDAALAALLHDIAANQYHRVTVPESRKHQAPVRFLSYSSASRNAQYCNRVAYEVLRGRSPRLDGPVGHDDDPEETPAS